MLTRHVPASSPRGREVRQESSGKTGEENLRATTLIGLSTPARLSTPPQSPRARRRTLSLTKFLPILSLDEGGVTSPVIANLCVRRPLGLGEALYTVPSLATSSSARARGRRARLGRRP
ncbi:hypothetical protein MRX96_009713 [Rhipicephalus microplus]